MIRFGLIGKPLSHSFSKSYFERKFKRMDLNDCIYENYELEKIEDIVPLVSGMSDLAGLNVTIPYKESIVKYMDQLSPEAEKVGAVNCVHILNKKLTGHNTDVYGFSQSIKPFLAADHQRALILGIGGSSKAVSYALREKGIDIYFVTSSEKKTGNSFYYKEVNDIVMNSFKLIINTTPLGMFPDANTCPDLPYHLFTPQHLAYDLVYNPEKTLFLKKAGEQGAITVNGLSMLQLQAEKSWEIWNSNQANN